LQAHLLAAARRIASALTHRDFRLLWTGALFVVQGIQPLLPLLRGDMPWAAALHPVLALVVFWLGISIGLQAWQLVREPEPTLA